MPENAVSEEWHKHQSAGVDLMPLKGLANLVMSSAEATRFFKLRGKSRKHTDKDMLGHTFSLYRVENELDEEEEDRGNVLWVALKYKMTPEEVCNYVRRFGDIFVLKDSETSAYIEIQFLDTEQCSCVAEMVETLNKDKKVPFDTYMLRDSQKAKQEHAHRFSY